MFKSITALTTVLIASAFTMSAQAEDAISVKFDYDANAPVERTYQSLERVAKKACKVDRREIRSYGVRMKIEDACRVDLIEAIVVATQDRTLLSHHAVVTGQDQLLVRYASVDK